VKLGGAKSAPSGPSKGKQQSSGQGANVPPKSLQKLLEEIKGTPEENVISTVMLRSMKQARYSPDSRGHYGLAAEFYSHFTSPIRRYPDLVIHRVMREVLLNGGALSEKREEYLRSRMGDIAQQSSERERLAVDAERETDQLKKAEFMLQHVGEQFDGVISSVTGFGMFVALDNTVEGLIRLSDLNDDYYHFHADHHMLTGERTGRKFRLGDPIRIVVARANVSDRTIDFTIAGSAGGTATSRTQVKKVAAGDVETASELSATERKKKKPNIWEIIERKKQATNAKQKKARTKDASYKRSKPSDGGKKGKKR
jgi:VacB/RNase II family 3'-5' exoribonuclease